jgi:polynucleotide 5'-hydroxyl-kinase GRC3/NOL9
MLAGTYTIMPLQSPIAITSTTIYPLSRNQPIPVFAPSSHPIPIISGSPSSKRSQPSPTLSKLPLPPTFQLGEARTIFLVREYECGLVGLRNGVVPGFSNIWGEDKGIWGLKLVHPVCTTHVRKVVPDDLDPRHHTYDISPTHPPRVLDSAFRLSHPG